MKDIIQRKIELHQFDTLEAELSLLKELSQEIVLYGLSKTDFFKYASFQGGTCLRIVHGLERFSEDLDFALKIPDPEFDLTSYLEKIKEVMELYGYNIEISGRDCVDRNVRTRMLKDDNILKQLNLKHHHDIRRKIKIKLEIDVNPPAHAKSELSYVDFPLDFEIVTHDRPSLFAGKCHALLTRNYIKGRDWYDYLWYIRQRIEPNWEMLASALKQSGNCPSQLETDWLQKEIIKKIKKIDWNNAKSDVENFLNPEEKNRLDIWGEDFFIQKTNNLHW